MADGPAAALPSELATRFCRGTRDTIPGWWDQLILSEDGSFSLEYFDGGGCEGGAASGKSAGHARLANGVLQFFPDGVAPQVYGGRDLLEPLRVIEWSGRIYLVPEAAMLRWCNAVNRGEEPRPALAGNFYVNFTEVVPRGKPEVPAQWEKYLLASTITGKTVKPAGATNAIVDIGGGSGLLPGMVLVLRRVPVDASAMAQGAPPFRDQNVVVTEVADRQSEVAWDHGGVSWPIPVGLTVTSRATCDN